MGSMSANYNMVSSVSITMTTTYSIMPVKPWTMPISFSMYDYIMSEMIPGSVSVAPDPIPQRETKPVPPIHNVAGRRAIRIEE